MTCESQLDKVVKILAVIGIDRGLSKRIYLKSLHIRLAYVVGCSL